LLPVATIRMPVVFLNLPPGHTRADTPLTLSWTFVLHAPVLQEADGTFDAPSVHSLLDPGGTLQGEISALSVLSTARRPVPVDVAVSPLLLAQLDRLQGGFRARDGTGVHEVPAGVGDAAAARDVLDRLRSLLRTPS